MTQNKAKLSVFIICRNEQQNIERCLKSITFADEIIIVDSGSTDRTLEICRQYTDRIFHKDWNGFVEQKSFAFSQCSNEWILNLDADEQVSDKLQHIIDRILSEPQDNGIGGYDISRVVYYMGKFWDKGGWYPEYRLRLVRKSMTTWGGSDPHEKAITTGKVIRIEEPIYHYTYAQIKDQITSLNNLSSAAAQSLFKKGKNCTVSSIFMRSFARFFKFYLFKKGFLEGSEGLVVAFMEAIYAFLKYAKLWELNRGNK